jgi:hypothetical protein
MFLRALQRSTLPRWRLGSSSNVFWRSGSGLLERRRDAPPHARAGTRMRKGSKSTGSPSNGRCNEPAEHRVLVGGNLLPGIEPFGRDHQRRRRTREAWTEPPRANRRPFDLVKLRLGQAGVLDSVWQEQSQVGHSDRHACRRVHSESVSQRIPD